MPLPVWCGHKTTYIASHDLVLVITKESLCRGAEGQNLTEFVDHDHRVGNGVEDRLKVLFPRVVSGSDRGLVGDVPSDDMKSAQARIIAQGRNRHTSEVFRA